MLFYPETETDRKSMAKQFDSGVVVIDGCVEQLMEMIAMPSVLLLRRSCWLLRARRAGVNKIQGHLSNKQKNFATRDKALAEIPLKRTPLDQYVAKN